MPPSTDPVSPGADNSSAKPERPGSSRLPTVAPDPTPGENRSRFDSDRGTVFFNETHGDYLMVKDSEAMLLDYLATLVAKEYVVYNNPSRNFERSRRGACPNAGSCQASHPSPPLAAWQTVT